eukprot:TRINITY_DN8274_c0_g1_i9.p1 TRINITY_DN8274_c0_g1~~TRINITY_DN8274_c0_g1_i9.p1  ORF type:complete len:314 (-),score=106.80 TRINITY_DN8274_c0_g1_i9:79-1020(-)
MQSSGGRDSSFGSHSLDKYTRAEPVGGGAYGVVYKGCDTQTGETIAVKRIKIEVENEGIPSTAIREIALLREIEHENVIKLKDVITSDQKLYLILEFVDRDLKLYLEQYGSKENLNPKLIKWFMVQLLRGISACHSRRIMHRDLKPQNILIDKNNNLKITDFGLARVFSIPIRPYTHEVVTLWYRAPEILLGSAEYSTPVDIWSAGCIFAELFNKQPLFMGDSEIDQLYRIFRTMGTPTETIWPGVSSLKDYKTTFPNWHAIPLNKLIPTAEPAALDLISKMLVYDPTQRLSAKAALEHPYLKNVARYTAQDK